jgi:hypothetical protein|tara:strand:+ start:167 stop:598 length:432 start_codon:yes stop_codon:yes gene_type:complete
MEKIKSASVKLNENGLLVDVKIQMRANDGDGLYIVHFAIVQENDDEFKFSVLATTNLSDAKTEDDLMENTSEIWVLPLDSIKNFEKARLILATMVKDGFYYQRTIYSWPNKADVEKADKQDVSQLRGEFKKLLNILREKQEQL